MKKVIAAVLFAALPVIGFASEGPALETAKVNLSDTESLQRGAKLFVNYCLSCHSAQYMRYNRVGQDLGMTDEEVKANLILNGAKVGDTMKVAMTPADAKAAFGVVPPDLSVIARSRGADYLYTYLRSFYADPKRPFGVNNTVFPDVGMPHVLAELQGVQTAVYKVEKDAEGKDVHAFEKFELTTPGSQTPEQYDATVTDLVNYMVYMGEPAQLQRTRIGWWVLGFLGLVLLPVSYLLKKEYWKDVH